MIYILKKYNNNKMFVKQILLRPIYFSNQCSILLFLKRFSIFIEINNKFIPVLK